MTAPSAETLDFACVSALIEILQIRHTGQASREIHVAMRFHRNMMHLKNTSLSLDISSDTNSQRG